jgi:predicted PurR-regulated permease PerM
VGCVQATRSPDLARTTFQLLALGILIVSSFWIVRPFLVASAWGAMIAIATWPVLLRAEAWLGGRRSLAVVVMTIALMLVLVVPFYFGVTSVVEYAGRATDWSQSLTTLTVPRPPEWLSALPVVGPRIASPWEQLAASTPEEISARLAPFARTAVIWVVGQVGSLGLLLLQLVLTVVVVAIMYSNGEAAAQGARRFARRLAGSEGEKVVTLAGKAVRAVALGVVVTAIVQTAFAGIGLAIAGVPFASILVALIFVLSVAQLGPGLVLLPATVWVYETRGVVWGTGFLAWAIFCSTFDNFLRPVLIKRGADLPLLLIFSGVVGGLLAFGVIGLFVGPVVLAVAYTLLVDWVSDGDSPGEESPPLAP